MISNDDTPFCYSGTSWFSVSCGRRDDLNGLLRNPLYWFISRTLFCSKRLTLQKYRKQRIHNRHLIWIMIWWKGMHDLSRSSAAPTLQNIIIIPAIRILSQLFLWSSFMRSLTVHCSSHAGQRRDSYGTSVKSVCACCYFWSSLSPCCRLLAGFSNSIFYVLGHERRLEALQSPVS